MFLSLSKANYMGPISKKGPTWSCQEGISPPPSVTPLTSTLTLKHKNVFGKTKWRLFSGKCPDTDFG